MQGPEISASAAIEQGANGRSIGKDEDGLNVLGTERAR